MEFVIKFYVSTSLKIVKTKIYDQNMLSLKVN